MRQTNLVSLGRQTWWKEEQTGKQTRLNSDVPCHYSSLEEEQACLTDSSGPDLLLKPKRNKARQDGKP